LYSQSDLLKDLVQLLLYPVLTVSVGAIIANVLLPRWQSSFLREKKRRDRLADVGEEIVANLNLYVTYWLRLIAISTFIFENQDHEDKAELQKALDRKENFIEQRNICRDRLLENISRFALYNDNESSVQELEDFVNWDRSLAVLTLAELPDETEWRTREAGVNRAVKRALSLDDKFIRFRSAT
jgi:hypothetical protein